MNYLTTSRSGCLFLPLRRDAKSLSSEGCSSTPYMNYGRGAAIAASAKQTISTSSTTSRTPTLAMSTRSSGLGAASPAGGGDSKWYREPKIPVRLSSSTLIRMKSKNSTANEQVMGESGADNQLTVAALSFLKRDRRMSDYEVANGVSPFGDASCVKNVCLNIVSRCGGSAARTAASANSFGDGVHTSATYHRISAFSLNDCESGCNVKVVEHVSYEGSAGRHRMRQTAAVEPAGQSSGAGAAVGNGAAGLDVCRLNAMLKQATLAGTRKPESDGGTAPSVVGDVPETRPQPGRTTKKKSSPKPKKAALHTSLKTSSLWLMRRNSRSRRICDSVEKSSLESKA